ncbi:MAG: LysM peptidoglycan-binding domain-containing protein [Caldilineaceae bacterium]|nr:LysM peptidoglycan-binding domain-containing protein [Caldilineaceae bacterium]
MTVKQTAILEAFIKRKLGIWVVSGAIALVIGGCGQVITLAPTPTPEPTATISMQIIDATLAPTATPAPYTPAPTPTSTITPTPVVHTIQPGESLLVVANLYDVSIATLQDANGILDPRSLQIGQQLVIPREEEAEETSESTPTATPLAVEVQNLHFNETTIGGLAALGEVVNNAGVALEQVRVGISLLDEQENEVTQAEALVALDLVDVDGRAPFAVLFGDVPEGFERYQAYPLSAVPAYVGSYYRDLEVRDLVGEAERYTSYKVSGVIYNAGPEEAVSVQVVVTAYDPLDRVIAMRKVVPTHNVVARGGETTFTAVLAPVGGPVSRVEAVAQGRRLSGAP